MRTVGACLLLFVLLVAGCATSGGAARSERIYAEPIETVVSATSDAIVEAGLNIEDQNWIVAPLHFRVLGYELSRAFNDPEGLVRTGSFTVDIKSVAPDRVKVNVETRRRSASAMASTADRTSSIERTLFSLLDEKLTSVERPGS